jgi:hypothetical protein
MILEFLKLQDIVKILTIIRENQRRIFPSALLLGEILQKALLPSSLDILFLAKTRDILKPALLIISEDKTVTLQTMRKLYQIIRGSITSELEPCPDITVKGRVCTFWNYVEQEKEEEEGRLTFKVIFVSSQCSNRECNQIVLWHCCVCERPCSECWEHATSCDYCYGDACEDCLVTEDMCKNCGFICIECEDVIYGNKMFCDGSRSNRSCPSAIGPYCYSCALPTEGPPKILTCMKCDRIACMECNCIM